MNKNTGRKSKYSESLKNRIVELIKQDTFTNEEIYRQCGITSTTFYKWKRTIPSFRQEIQQAHEELMQSLSVQARHSLRKKVNGYEIDEKQIVTVPGEDGRPKIKEQRIKHIHIPPDTAAIIFALTNADPEHWKNRQNSEITGRNGKGIFSDMSLFSDLNIEDLKKKAEELRKKIDTQNQHSSDSSKATH